MNQMVNQRMVVLFEVSEPWWGKIHLMNKVIQWPVETAPTHCEASFKSTIAIEKYCISCGIPGWEDWGHPLSFLSPQSYSQMEHLIFIHEAVWETNSGL